MCLHVCVFLMSACTRVLLLHEKAEALHVFYPCNNGFDPAIVCVQLIYHLTRKNIDTLSYFATGLALIFSSFVGAYCKYFKTLQFPAFLKESGASKTLWKEIV